MKVNKTKIDLRDLWRCHKYTYRRTGRPGNDYLAREARRADGKRATVKLHREIMGAKVGEFVDHIDGDRFNNSRPNLRICTSTQNNRNAKKRKDGKSKYKGVYPIFNTTDKKWAAHISVEGLRKFLGCYATEEEAAQAYNHAAQEFHKDFARINQL